MASDFPIFEGGPTAALPPPPTQILPAQPGAAAELSAVLPAAGGPPTPPCPQTPLSPHRGSWGGVLQLPPPSPPRFSPDSLGLQASSALAWLLLEVLAVLLSLYLFSLPTDLSTPDLLAFAGYKYVG